MVNREVEQLYRIVDVNNELVDEYENMSLRAAEACLCILCNEDADVYIQDM